MAQLQTTPAFLLKSNDLGESDRLLVFYSRDAGKIRGVARAAKKSRRRFGAALDWFHLVKLSYRPGRGELFHLDHLDEIWRSQAIAQNMVAYALGSYFLELVRELTDDHHADPQVFDLLHSALQRLENLCLGQEVEAVMSRQGLALARLIEIRLLDLLGFRPHLDACVECHKPGDFSAAAARFLQFSVSKGGVVCGHCVQHRGRSHFGGLVSVSLADVEILRSLLKEEEPHSVQLPASEGHSLSRLMSAFIEYHTHKKMRSLEVMQSTF